MTTLNSMQIQISDALLRNLGGRSVLLLLPAPAVPGDTGEQLGLAQPRFQNASLSPVILRRMHPKVGNAENPREAQYELLVSASAVASIVGSLAFQSADILFSTASGIQIDDSILGITWVATSEAFGTVFLYRLGLRGAVKDTL